MLYQPTPATPAIVAVGQALYRAAYGKLSAARPCNQVGDWMRVANRQAVTNETQAHVYASDHPLVPFMGDIYFEAFHPKYHGTEQPQRGDTKDLERLLVRLYVDWGDEGISLAKGSYWIGWVRQAQDAMDFLAVQRMQIHQPEWVFRSLDTELAEAIANLVNALHDADRRRRQRGADPIEPHVLKAAATASVDLAKALKLSPAASLAPALAE